jgi:uncharacterized membrane protein
MPAMEPQAKTDLRYATYAPDEGARANRATRRLEAFSDIVIGFSLAQLGLTLVIPAHAIEFVTRPAGIFAFIVTFAVVGRFWWVNYFTFEHFFRPNRLMVALNFIALGSLLLQIFALQLYLHFVPLKEGVIASRIYFALFALSYGIQGLMLALGLAYRWKSSPAALRRVAVRVLLSRFGIVVATTIGNLRANNDLAQIFITVGKQSTLVANLPGTIFFDTLIGLILGLLASWILPRFFRSLRTA